MADFCRQCSVDHFGKDTRDFAGLTTEEETQRFEFAVVVCEGCGFVHVDHEGSCVTDCLKHHGKPRQPLRS